MTRMVIPLGLLGMRFGSMDQRARAATISFSSEAFASPKSIARLRVEVELVVDAGEAGAHAALEDDDVLRPVDVEDRHPVERAVAVPCAPPGFVTSFAPITSATSVRGKSGFASLHVEELP